MKMKPTIWLLFFLSTALAREIEVPKGWTVEKQSGHLLLRPEKLSGQQNVQARIYDAEALPDDLSAWLKIQISKRGGSFVDVTSCRPKLRAGKESSCTTKSGGADQYWYALQTTDNQARFMHVTMGPSTLSAMRFISPIGRILKEATANAGHAGSASPEITVKAESAPSEPAGDFFPQSPAADPVAAPKPAPTIAQNPPSSSLPLEGIYLHLEYQTGVGGGVYPVYVPYVFYSDGRVTSDLTYYPSSAADIANWKQKRPKGWGRWSRNGEEISLQWDDPQRKPSLWKKSSWHLARSAPGGYQLSGAYGSIGGGGNTALGGTTMVAAWNNYNFSPDGTMTNGKGAMGSNEQVTSTSQRSNQGTYQVEGTSIHFRYADGKQERRWFFLFPDSDNVIGIGNTVFNKSTSKKSRTTRSRKAR